MDQKREREESVESVLSPTKVARLHGCVYFESIDAILSPTKVTKVHGYITSLLPMKESAATGNDYFVGEVKDASRGARFVGFGQT